MNEYEYYKCRCGRNHPVGVECAIGRKRVISHPIKHYQVEVDKNGCERCGEGKLWVIVANGIAGSTSYANEDEAVEICDALNDAFEAGRASLNQ